MAKTKRKKRAEVKDKEDSKKFWMVVGVSTLILMFLLYLMFSRIS